MSTTATDSDAEVKEQVGLAWSQSYHGKTDSAIRSFEGIISRWPNHVDANYGLSLALKNAAQREKATESFQKTRKILEEELTKVQGDEIVRYQMLMRMVEQQLATLVVK
jgi:Tfp pilus assembly protein PilF